jgi:hypothetical protein
MTRDWVDVTENICVWFDIDDYDEYGCNCDDPRHHFPNKYNNFKCKCYWIAMKKLSQRRIDFYNNRKEQEEALKNKLEEKIHETR